MYDEEIYQTASFCFTNYLLACKNNRSNRLGEKISSNPFNHILKQKGLKMSEIVLALTVTTLLFYVYTLDKRIKKLEEKNV